MRRRLFGAERGLGPNWEAAEPLGPGAHCYAVRMNGLRRLRGGVEPRGKTSPESRLRSHDGEGGERDEWRERGGGWTWREPGGTASV